MAKSKDLVQLEKWRNRLWKTARKAAEGHDGPSAVDALKRTTRKLNGIGMDDLYDKISKTDSTDGLYCAFDITWLAAFAVELKRSLNS